MTKTLKITEKGQITIPKAFRELLGTNTVQLEIENKQIYIKPVKTVAGSLNKYAKNPSISFEKEREIAWGDVKDEK